MALTYAPSPTALFWLAPLDILGELWHNIGTDGSKHLCRSWSEGGHQFIRGTREVSHGATSGSSSREENH